MLWASAEPSVESVGRLVQTISRISEPHSGSGILGPWFQDHFSGFEQFPSAEDSRGATGALGQPLSCVDVVSAVGNVCSPDLAGAVGKSRSAAVEGRCGVVPGAATP